MGIWVALGLLALVALPHVVERYCFGALPGAVTSSYTIIFFERLTSIGSIALWLWAAMVCSTKLRGSREVQAADAQVLPQLPANIRFVVCMSQGVIPVLLYPISKLLNEFFPYLALKDSSLSFFSKYPGSYVYEITDIARSLSRGAIEGIWLIGLLVLFPLGIRLAWYILIAGCAGWVTSSSVYFLEQFEQRGPGRFPGFWHLGAGWEFLISAALLGGMFYLFGSGRYLLGRVLSWLLIIPLLTVGALSTLYSYGMFPLAGRLIGVPLAILHLYSSPPSMLLRHEMGIYERWPLWQPALFPVLQWLDAFVYILWVAILFAAMYYFLRWVEKSYPAKADVSDAAESKAT